MTRRATLAAASPNVLRVLLWTYRLPHGTTATASDVGAFCSLCPGGETIEWTRLGVTRTRICEGGELVERAMGDDERAAAIDAILEAEQSA